MKIPSTNVFDQAFQGLIKAGEEYAGIKAAIDIYERSYGCPWTCKFESLRSYLYERKEAAFDAISARLATLEEMIEE